MKIKVRKCPCSTGATGSDNINFTHYGEHTEPSDVIMLDKFSPSSYSGFRPCKQHLQFYGNSYYKLVSPLNSLSYELIDHLSQCEDCQEDRNCLVGLVLKAKALEEERREHNEERQTVSKERSDSEPARQTANCIENKR